MSLADRVQLAKLLRASTACDDVLLSVLAVARGPLFKADASEGQGRSGPAFPALSVLPLLDRSVP